MLCPPPLHCHLSMIGIGPVFILPPPPYPPPSPPSSSSPNGGGHMTRGEENDDCCIVATRRRHHPCDWVSMMLCAWWQKMMMALMRSRVLVHYCYNSLTYKAMRSMRLIWHATQPSGMWAVLQLMRFVPTKKYSVDINRTAVPGLLLLRIRPSPPELSLGRDATTMAT